MTNRLKTTLRLSLLTVPVILMGSVPGSQAGMTFAFFMALANALLQLHAGSHAIPIQEARPASAHMVIVNPLTGGNLLKLLSTHTPRVVRIARLETMARGGQW